MYFDVSDHALNRRGAISFICLKIFENRKDAFWSVISEGVTHFIFFSHASLPSAAAAAERTTNFRPSDNVGDTNQTNSMTHCQHEFCRIVVTR